MFKFLRQVPLLMFSIFFLVTPLELEVFGKIPALGSLTNIKIMGVKMDKPGSISPNYQAYSEGKFLPFFDQENNPIKVSYPKNQSVDITPPPPPLNEFDRGVLATCGPINSNVTEEKFKKLMLKHPKVLEKIQKAVGGELRPGRNRKDLFLADLTDIWFTRRGFQHIFCGQLKSASKIGGLHFVGRYLQLQEEGIGGRLANNSRNEQVLAGVIYTVGIAIKRGDQIFIDKVKGYSYVTNAEEILLVATETFKEQGTKFASCLINMKDQETGKTFKAVFVKDRKSIVTFYPDVTPKGASCNINL